MKNLAGQVALVTGGGSGIGLAISRSMVEAGMNVMLASRRSELLEEQVHELNALGPGVASAVSLDVRDKQQAAGAASATLERFGSLDVLVNNAGLGVQDRVIDCPEENWDLVLDTCTKGTFLMSQAVLPFMQEQRKGFILNIASQAAINGYANAAPYCAAKFAVLGFGLALQEEVKEFGIKVHSLCPGLVQVPTPKDAGQIKDGWLQTEDLAALAMFVIAQPGRVQLGNIGLWGV